jgi:predicted phosphoribosyltransferase
VSVGFEVARVLAAPLDLVVVGKIGVSRITLSDEAESTVFDGLPASVSQTL